MRKLLILLLACILSVSHVTHAANTAPSGSGWLLFTTIAPTMGIIWSFDSTTEGIAWWYYKETSCLNRIKMSETSFFAIENFDQMQQERFYTDKPYIDAFAELTGLSSTDIEAMLASRQADLSSEKFLTTIIQQMSKKIMDDGSTSLEEKTIALSKILLIDGEVADAIEDNDANELYELLASCQESDGEYDYGYDSMGHIIWETYSTEVGELKVKHQITYEDYNYDNQLVGEGTFINGMPYDGLIRNYSRGNEYCRLSDINYKDGKMEGLAKFYHYSTWGVWCDGEQLEHEVNYKDGKATGLVRYYNADGSLAGEGSFIDDLPQDGLIRYYRKDGNMITREMTYKDGKLNGLAKFYMSYELYEKDDQTFSLNGAWLVNDEYDTGNPIRYIATYEDGKLISGSCTIDITYDIYTGLNVEYEDIAGQIKENAELDEHIGIIDEVSDYYDEYELEMNFTTGKYSCYAPYTPIIEGEEGATRILRKYVDLP